MEDVKKEESTEVENVKVKEFTEKIEKLIKEYAEDCTLRAVNAVNHEGEVYPAIKIVSLK